MYGASASAHKRDYVKSPAPSLLCGSPDGGGDPPDSKRDPPDSKLPLTTSALWGYFRGLPDQSDRYG